MKILLPVQKDPRELMEKLSANARVLMRSLLPQSQGGSAFVYFILVYPVLTQTVPRPCGSRTFNSRPWEKKAAVDVQ